MKTIRIRRSFLTLFILTAVLSLFLAIPSLAAGSKLVKSYETKDAKGKVTDKGEYKYDSKGNMTKATYWYYTDDGKVEKNTFTYKLTYWKGTGNLKKSVYKAGDYSVTVEYKKNGVLKKSTSKSKSGDAEITTYTSSGKKLKSFVRKNGDGKVTGKGTYDGKGNLKTTVYYDLETKKQYKSTFSYTYKNGVLRKEVQKSGEYTYTLTYNSKGDLTEYVSKGPDGTAKTSYKYKYNNGYMVSSKEYNDGTYLRETTYKYTSKSY